jgi:hypothetical protein
MQFSAKFEDADSQYFYQLTHWFLHRLTSRDVLYPTVQTADLYHIPFKSYKHSPQAPFFQKWILVIYQRQKFKTVFEN